MKLTRNGLAALKPGLQNDSPTLSIADDTTKWIA
jgi:hypothetical protein